mmetsp:Transcript_31151/g.53299  ORF Transcript_31151/g.53299 Transcript_31151/m.53299 type:complete len:649 (+) Transcript_31151:990-2936(+)
MISSSTALRRTRTPIVVNPRILRALAKFSKTGALSQDPIHCLTPSSFILSFNLLVRTILFFGLLSLWSISSISTASVNCSTFNAYTRCLIPASSISCNNAAVNSFLLAPSSSLHLLCNMEAVSSFFKATKAAVLNIPEMEQKVLDATNNQKWGPTGPEMKEISAASHRYTEFPLIMKTIYGRLCERNPQEWRHVYKALLLLDYMLKNGSYQVVTDAQAHMSIIMSLDSYSAFENSEDKGISVRERAKLICELLRDKRRLDEEREKAQANRQKFQASMSSEGGGYGGRYAGGNNYSNNYDSSSDYSSRNTYSSSNYTNTYDQSTPSSTSNYESNYSPSVSRASGSTSSYTPGYTDSRPTSSKVNPKTRYDSSAYLTDSDEEDDIPENLKVQATSARPRAPSGGSSTLAPPPKSSSATIDLLGIGDPSPASNTPTQPQQPSATDFFGSQGMSGQTQQTQNFDFGAFSGSTGNSMGQQTFMGAQPSGQQPTQTQQNLPRGEGKQTLNGSFKRTAATSPEKPQLSAEDSKDPWKKGAGLFSLDSLGGSKQPMTPTQSSTGQKISLSSAGNSSNVQYSNLRMGNMGGNMNMNSNMMGGNPNMMGNQNMMGGNMGNMNMMGNPNMMRGNMNGNMMGGNPNMMGNMGGNNYGYRM